MRPVSRTEYVQAIVERYHAAGRKEKRRILDEFRASAGIIANMPFASLEGPSALREPAASPAEPHATTSRIPGTP